MGVYRVEIVGRRKPILLRAKNKTEAIDRVVTKADSLTAEEVEEALDGGEKLWKAGDDLPADDPEPTETNSSDKGDKPGGEESGS